jgi:hypothetical protein
MTLTEVIVYCVLLSLFSIMLFVNLPNRGNATAEDLHEVATEADYALKRLTLEAGNTSATSLTITKSPSGVVFLAANDDGYSNFTYTNAGEIAWKGWVGYFLQGDDLIRVWYPFKSGVARAAVTTAPNPSEMIASESRQVLCDKVTSFSIINAEANLWQFELKLNIDGSQATLTSGAAARN